MSIVNVKYLNMGKRGYSFPLSTNVFCCKSNGVAKAMGTLLEKFHFSSLLVRSISDSKGYVRHHLYGAKGYMHCPKLEYFWEDCLDDAQVFKRSYMRLSLQQIHTLNVSFNVLDDVIKDEVITDPEYHTIANVVSLEVDWSKEEVSDLMICISLVLKRTSN